MQSIIMKMKAKNVLPALAGAMLALQASAQHWDFSLQAGYLNNHITTQKLTSGPFEGFTAGATADVTFPCRLTCETGLHYRWMRGTLKGPMPYNGLHFRLDRMDYLQLPLAVGYRFCPMPHFTLTPKIGGYVALGLKADGWIEGTDHYQQPFGAAADLFRHTRIPADYRPFNRFDSGILTGVGLTYRHLGLDVSYQLGLTHLAATYDSRLQQRSWNISLSYRFR